MPVPDFQGFLAPVLRFTSDGAHHAMSELRQKIAADMRLTPEEIAQKLPSGVQTVLANRIAWSTVYLTKAGALTRIKRGVFQITERGKDLLQKHPDKITIEMLYEFPEFVAFHKRGLVERG
jgi:restriction system protein